MPLGKLLINNFKKVLTQFHGKYKKAIKIFNFFLFFHKNFLKIYSKPIPLRYRLTFSIYIYISINYIVSNLISISPKKKLNFFKILLPHQLLCLVVKFNLVKDSKSRGFSISSFVTHIGKIIRYSRSTINAYSLLSHEWWVPSWI